MNWTKEAVFEILNSNSEFKDLSDEFKGNFGLLYEIQGNRIYLSNAVNGVAEVFIILPICKKTISDAYDFAMIAKEILNEQINSR
jgi:hypothetical protein